MPGAESLKRALKWLAVLSVLVALVTVTAKPSHAQQQRPASPLSRRQIEGLVRGGVYSGRIALLIGRRGIDFKPSQSYLQTLRKEGAQDALIQALLAASPAVPAPVNDSPVHSTLKASGPTGHHDSPARAKIDGASNQDATAADRARLTSVLALAEQYDQQKRWPEAEQQYRAAISLEPGRASTYVALGRVLIAENDPQVAMREYRRAINLEPGLADAHEALGNLMVQNADIRNGIREYGDALRLNSHDTAVRAKLAALLYSTGDLQSAVTEYHELETGNPEDPDLHFRLGLALYDEQNLAAAAAQFRETLWLDAAFTQAHGALGDVLLKQGDRYGALQQYRMAAGSSDPSLRETFDWLSKNLKH
ncbi:MAG TPA: tetratricopeptide repeat protein [Terriglobia bacterium]|nr:tetratricopeptide repeat protein [Terriglobia bacterium]